MWRGVAWCVVMPKMHIMFRLVATQNLKYIIQKKKSQIYIYRKKKKTKT
jgi:hypothetical protein